MAEFICVNASFDSETSSIRQYSYGTDPVVSSSYGGRGRHVDAAAAPGYDLPEQIQLDGSCSRWRLGRGPGSIDGASAAESVKVPDGVIGSPSNDTPDPHRWIILAVLAVAQLMIVLDASIVNIALPSAQGELGISNAAGNGS